MRHVGRVLVLLTIIALVTASALASRSKPRTITIGTAGVMGVYYPLGGAICRMLGATRKEHGLRCAVEASEGSVANIDGVLAGDYDLGFAQSDTQYHAAKGDGPFKEPKTKLRALFNVYPEIFIVMARQGSGTRATMELVMRAFGLKRADFASAVELKFIELSPALCDNKIDAFVFVAGHPNAVLQDAATSCDATIVRVAGAPIDALIAERPYYVKAETPGRMYKGTDTPQASFGSEASVVVSADMPDDTAYAITKAVFANFDDFRKLHPAISGLTKEGALQGAALPFHPGAVRYYKEAGLLP
jgi:TRAP-type uncharacterized transport system substrate-binding protein